MSQPTPDSVGPPAPAPSKIGPRLLLAVTLLLSTLFWLATFAQLITIVPLTQMLMNSYKMRCPWLSDLVMYDFWWIVPVIGVVALSICAALRKRWAWNFALLVLPLFLNWTICFCLFFPISQLLLGLQNHFAAGQ